MKLLNIKLYGRHNNDTIHKAFTTWFVGALDLLFYFFFAHLSRSGNIGRPPSSAALRRPHSLNIFSETTGPTKA